MLKRNVIVLSVQDRFQVLEVVEKPIQSGVHQKPIRVIVDTADVREAVAITHAANVQVALEDLENGEVSITRSYFDALLSSHIAVLANRLSISLEEAADVLHACREALFSLDIFEPVTIKD